MTTQRQPVFLDRHIYYMTPQELNERLEAGDGPLLVVDVRDDDAGTTMIRGTTVNVPSKRFTRAALEGALDTAAPGRSLADFDAVVVHCMYSQTRGPRCARLIDEMYPLRDFGLYVLRGGFCNFSVMYPAQVAPRPAP